ncbi:MAG: cell envelope integrity protein CreD, partial [Calditrichaeota bacterium]
MNRETLQNSAGLRVAIIAGLTLVLCIPALFIQFLIYERENRQVEAVREVTAKWGESQYLTGPVLSVPVLYEKKQTDGTINKIKRLLYVLPGDFSVAGHLYPEMRYRGIYQILLYNSDLQFSGNFILPSKEELDLEGGTLQLHEALLEFGISDPAGISDRIEIKWNDAVFEAKPGIRNCNTIKAGFHTNSPIDEKSDISTFQFSTRIKGSERLSVTPVGEETTASLSGKWSHPSFTGDFLPHIRKIDENQFSAEWKILNLNRNFPHYSMVS